MTTRLEPQGWALEMAATITRWGIEGAPVPHPVAGKRPFRLKSAAELAGDYRQRARRVGLGQAIRDLIEDQARWNAGTGFVTGIGGFAFLPVQLPASITATWVIQTRLVAAIADLYGFDLAHEAVRTQILLTLLGEEAGEVLKQLGVKTAQQIAQAQLRRLPATTLQAIHRAVGFRLVTRSGQRGMVHLHRVIPLLGGVVGGGIDYWMTRQLGDYAIRSLAPRRPADLAEEDIIDVEVVEEDPPQKRAA
jgi:uncharacterized protein (DUF697 family)